jgi:hypothetical protein
MVLQGLSGFDPAEALNVLLQLPHAHLRSATAMPLRSAGAGPSLPCPWLADACSAWGAWDL